VAKYILHSFEEEISTMKLQKLCYYCQAWHLAWHGIPLFPEHFKRRDNGPVCMELFNVHCGKLIVKEKDIADRLLSGDMFSLVALDTINQILEDYGKFNGAQLTEISHQEDPWINALKDEIIPNEAIEEYYKNLKDEEE
jgi:uncharacterized phage-associated protein